MTRITQKEIVKNLKKKKDAESQNIYVLNLDQSLTEFTSL